MSIKKEILQEIISMENPHDLSVPWYPGRKNKGAADGCPLIYNLSDTKTSNDRSGNRDGI